MDTKCQAFDPHCKLKANEVHIIKAELSQDPALIEKYWQSLSEDEKHRANQFKFSKHRAHFIIARGILRSILSIYTGITAQSLEFAYEEHGKPYLKFNPGSLQFNLSHTDGMALYGLCLDAKIGVDIEALKACETLELAKRFFAQDEHQSLSDMPETERQKIFFHIWTQKEAFIKALGSGLFQALDEFSVSSISPGQLLSCRIAGEQLSDWHLETFTIQGLQAAYATKQRVKNACYWQWVN